MPHAENPFRPRTRFVVRDNMEPVMLPGNGLITRVVTAWSGDDFDDVVKDNAHMFTESSRNTMIATGRAIPNVQSTRSKQGQGKLVDLTHTDNESGNVSTDSDRPLVYHTQAVRTGIDAGDKATEKSPCDYKQGHSPLKATSATVVSLIDDTASNNTPLPDDHEPKFLSQARRDYPFVRPPFVRLNRKDLLDPKRLTFATPDGQFPQREIPGTLAIRAWDTKSSFHTLDINGERLIVKPTGGKSTFEDQVASQYRAWSGQGNAYESIPVAFGLKEDAGDQDSTGKDPNDNVEPSLEEGMVHNLDAANDADYIHPSSEGSSPKNEVEQDSGFQQMTRETNASELPATRAPLIHLNTNHDDQARIGLEAGLSIGLGPEPRAGLSALQPRLPEASAAAPRIQEVIAGKRQAPDALEEDRSSKKGRSERVDTTINDTAIARVPPSLTIHKQERTILYVSLPGSVSNVVAIKLCSAMSISTLFSSVCNAVGIKDYVNLAIAIMLAREDGAPERSMIIRRNSIEAFEILLEAVDEAPCWNEEGGKLSFRLHLKSMVELEMAMRVRCGVSSKKLHERAGCFHANH